MKKSFGIIAAIFTVTVLSACGNNAAEDSSTNESKTETSFSTIQDKEKFGNSLVVYFSMPETNDPENMTEEEENSAVVIDGKVLGNTQYVAETIQEQLGAEIFRIEPETAYPTDHEKLVDLASQEQEDKARPALKEKIAAIDQYDTIFLGYPNWWGDMPMILYSFLDETDFAGKTIIPFNTHGGSGFSDTINSIKQEEPEATVIEEGYSVNRDAAAESKPEVIAWLNDLDI